MRIGQWSADGHRIFFSVRNGLYEIPASGGTPRRLDDDPGHKDHPVWSASGGHSCR
jgi:Tol biopolymer transport system component